MKLSHPLHKEGSFHIDTQLYENIKEAPKRINKDKDVVILICGDPGNGKSTLASQIAFMWDNTIIKNSCIHSTMEAFRSYALELGKNQKSRGKANIHDEARETGGMNVLKKKVSRFWDFIYENRFLNMYQILIQSDFWRTPIDIVFNRALFMLWVIEDSDWNNGQYLFYGKKDMRKLYERGKKKKDRKPSGYSFTGRFTKFWAANPEYLKIKEDNFYDKYDDKDKESKLTIKDVLYFIWQRNSGVRPKDVVNLIKVSETYYFQVKKDYEVNYTG